MKILITGANGMLARALSRELEARGFDIIALDREGLDVRDQARVSEVVSDHNPDLVIQGAAYTRVDDAEHEESMARLINAEATAYLADACQRVGARLIYPSTDYVFDGRGSTPYTPDAPTSPLGAYGRSKLAGEIAARRAGSYLVVRTSWLYGEEGANFVSTILERAARGEPLRVVDDQRGSPTWTGSLAQYLADLIEGEAPSGTYHLVNRGDVTWYGLAVAAILLAGLDTEVTPVRSAEFPRPAPRPPYSVLDSTRTEELVGPIPEWSEALAEAIRAGGIMPTPR